MYSEQTEKNKKRIKRALRVRKPLIKSKHMRLSVFRSAKHIFAQIIDDRTGVTLVSMGSYDKELRKIKEAKEVAKEVGVKLAELAKAKQVDVVVFDRGRYKFHGRVAALAEGARQGGLSF